MQVDRHLTGPHRTTMYSTLLAAALLAGCQDNPAGPGSDGPVTDVPGGIVTVVTPDRITAETDQPVRLSAFARDAAGDTVPGIELEWSVTGGTITESGEFTAAATGTYYVSAKGKENGKGHDKKATPDTTIVVVVPPAPTLTAVELTPATASVGAGASQQFVAKGVQSDGSKIDIGVEWSATGGSIDAAGDYTAGSTAGTFRVIAASVSQPFADTAIVTVTKSAATLETIVLTPATVSLEAGRTQQFEAKATMSDGATAPAAVEYTATGGTIDESGLYSAGTTSGSYQVIATHAASGKADTSSVTIAVVPSGPSTTITPGMDIQDQVDAHGAGTSFLIKSGVHRLQEITPKDGMSFIGEPGAILSGARLLTSFTREGSYWVAGGQTQQGRTAGQCSSSNPMCREPEDLFIDDVAQRRVGSLGEVGSGEWYFDYGSDRVYMGSDPSGRTVEIGVERHAFAGTAQNVTIEGLVVEKYANEAQHGAIHGLDGTGWVVRNNEVRLNHGVGITTGERIQVVANNSHHNGQMGITGQGSGVLVQDNEIAYNNQANYSMGWEAGGTKFVKTVDLVVRGNYVHHNKGPGLWTDINNINTLYEHNRVEDNADIGIFHEISYKAVIRNNTIARNGFGYNRGWVWGAGITIAASPDVEVYGNTVTDNRHGIMGIQQYRSETAMYGPHEIWNLNVHDNIVTMSVGETGLAQDVGDKSVYTDRNNRFENNTYHLGSSSRYFSWMDSNISESQWRSYGHDDGGTFHR